MTKKTKTPKLVFTQKKDFQAWLHTQCSADMPMVVITQASRSVVAFITNRRTDTPWNHAMMLADSDTFYSQKTRFRKVPVAKYLDGKHTLCIWRNPGLNFKQRWEMREVMADQLRKKGWYDAVGVGVGQLWASIFHLPVLRKVFQVPGLHYCSEAVCEVLVKVIPKLKDMHLSPGGVDDLLEVTEGWEKIIYAPEL